MHSITKSVSPELHETHTSVLTKANISELAFGVGYIRIHWVTTAQYTLKTTPYHVRLMFAILEYFQQKPQTNTQNHLKNLKNLVIRLVPRTASSLALVEKAWPCPSASEVKGVNPAAPVRVPPSVTMF